MARNDLRYALARDGGVAMQVLAIDGARLEIDTARWPARGAGSRSGKFPLPGLRLVVVRDAAVIRRSATSVVTARVNGSLAPGTQAGEFAAATAVLGLVRNGQMLESGRLTAAWYADRGLHVVFDTAALRAEAEVATDAGARGPPFVLSGTADAALVGTLTGAFATAHGIVHAHARFDALYAGAGARPLCHPPDSSADGDAGRHCQLRRHGAALHRRRGRSQARGGAVGRRAPGRAAAPGVAT